MSANGKPRFAMYWAASCGGCDVAVLNLHEKIVDVAANFDIVFWPCAMDGKYADVEAMPDGAIDLTFFSGSIRSDENLHLAKLLRRTSKILVAFGSCASEGCIPGLANLTPVSEMVSTAFETPSTDNPGHLRPQPSWTVPEGVIHIPTLAPVVRTLDQVVEVDYTIPGCPPESARIAEVVALAIDAFAGRAELPPKGSVIGAGVSTVCDECARARNVKKISAFTRIQSVAALDPTLCILEQGIPCNGPATRDGCGALCPAAGAPCIGCYGPTEGVVDVGARMLAAIASVVDATEAADIDRILDGLPDPVGTIYRFGLARSLLRASRDAFADGAGNGSAPPGETPTSTTGPALAGARRGTDR
jgi:F420-non-reducing hydrogenase small subunit